MPLSSGTRLGPYEILAPLGFICRRGTHVGEFFSFTMVPPRILNLEQAIEFVRDDEMVGITPKSIRLRKRVLKANQR